LRKGLRKRRNDLKERKKMFKKQGGKFKIKTDKRHHRGRGGENAGEKNKLDVEISGGSPS